LASSAMNKMMDEAHGELEQQYKVVERFVRRHTGDRVAAEDLTQQVFVEAAGASPGAVAMDNALLFTIAKRRMIDYFRKPRMRLVSLERANQVPDHIEENPGVADAVADAIRKLEPDQRQVVVLKLIHGLPFAEVAQIVGASEGACKMRLRRALAHLRDDLEKRGVQR